LHIRTLTSNIQGCKEDFILISMIGKIFKVHGDLSQGYSKLFPSLNCSKIITKWKLYVPKSWVKDFKE